MEKQEHRIRERLRVKYVTTINPTEPTINRAISQVAVCAEKAEGSIYPLSALNKDRLQQPTNRCEQRTLCRNMRGVAKFNSILPILYPPRKPQSGNIYSEREAVEQKFIFYPSSQTLFTVSYFPRLIAF